MTSSKASAQWQGSLEGGSGTTTLDTSQIGTYDVTWTARIAPGSGTTNPEELIAAAHAACYSMALSNTLEGAGHTLDRVDTQAEVAFTPGTEITGITLITQASVPGISAEEFARLAEETKTGCPVSQALAATPITLNATLV